MSGIHVARRGNRRRDLRTDARAFHGTLVAAGHDGTYREFRGGHDHACWRGSLADGIVEMLGGNINAGNTMVALVIDDLISLSPFIARAMRVYGYAERPVERIGMVGPGLYSRITPTISWSWNLAGEPAGGTWYEPRRTVHPVPG